MGVGSPCPPIRNNIVTPRHLFFVLSSYTREYCITAPTLMYLSPFLGSGPNGDFCTFLRTFVSPPQPGGSDLSLKAQTLASRAQIQAARLKSQPQGQIPASRNKRTDEQMKVLLCSTGSNPSLKAQIPASRLKFQPQSSYLSLKA